MDVTKISQADSEDVASPDAATERARWEAPRLSRLAVSTTDAVAEGGADGGALGFSQSS